jgi:hypothetical protein
MKETNDIYTAAIYTRLHMLRHPQRVVAPVERDKLRLEKDVAPDLEVGRGRLDAAEAR